MQVLAEIHDRRKRQSPFVQRLQEIRKDHDGQNPLVNHPLQALVVRLRHLDAVARGIFRNLRIDSTMVVSWLDRILNRGRSVGERNRPASPLLRHVETVEGLAARPWGVHG